MTRPLQTLPLLALLFMGDLLPAQGRPPQEGGAPVSGAAGPLDQAYARMQKQDAAAALPHYEQALALAPDRAETWNDYGICLRTLHRLPAAARAGWRAIQLDRRHAPQPWHAQATTFMDARAWSAAEACLEQMERLAPDRPVAARAWLTLAFRRLSLGETEGVVALCHRAIRLDPGSSLAWVDLGQALACAGEAKEARASLEKGLALAEGQKDAQWTEYARQLLAKVEAGEAVWPTSVAPRAWQVLPAGLLGLPEQDTSLLPLPILVEHRYRLEGGETLALAVPETWGEGFLGERPGVQFTAQFTRPGAEGFKVLFSPLAGGGNPLGVKDTADGVAKRLLAGSVETDLAPQPFTSPTAQGYWLLSTNRKTGAGEYRHLLTAVFAADGLQCVGTVLTNARTPEVVDPCLEVFRSARRIRATRP